MTKKSLAFGIILSVMFSVSWSASAQTLSDKERLLGTWKLSEIEDDSGDRSGEIDKYLDLGTMTFLETPQGDTLNLYFSPKDSISTDDISIDNLITFEVNESTDSLIAVIPLLVTLPPLPSHYVFDSDAKVTFVMDSNTINGGLYR